MILFLQETLGYTHLFVIIINLRITFKMKVILNCPPKEESEYCEKIKSSNWKGDSSLPLWVKPLQVSEGFKQSKDHHILTDLHPLWKRTFLWGQLFWGLLLAKTPISVPSEMKVDMTVEGWIWGFWVDLGTILCGMSAWHDMVKTMLCLAHGMCQPTPLQSWPASPYALSWLLFPTSLILTFLSFPEFIHMIYERPRRYICCV